MTTKRTTALAWATAGGLALVLGCSNLTTPRGATSPAANRAENSPRPAGDESDRLRFLVSFPEKVRSQPVTGRILLFLSTRSGVEPRRADYFHLPAAYGIDVTNLHPGDVVTFLPDKFRGNGALAFPDAMDRLPAGNYFVQALIDSDETMADFNAGPGNLYSTAVRCELDGSRGGTRELVADQVIRETPPLDTDWVKLVEMRSTLLSEFHGREVKLRAAVILPSTFHDRVGDKFPALYVIPGFGGRHTDAWRWIQSPRGQRWQKGDVPLQMLRVVVDPHGPLGHTALANSANNGPVGDAFVRELMPEIERRFRGLPEPRARFLSGHSSGGWTSLWLQIAYSDLFNGCWSTAPDPVDFRAFQTVNIYDDRNGHWTRDGLARPVARTRTEAALSFARLNLWEYVTGWGGQLDSFNAVFSPRGPDGRPRRVMDKLTGVIDREVAGHWRRYDIRRVLQENWSNLSPDLMGKIHVIAGETDTFYLDEAVRLLGEFLRKTPQAGTVELVAGDHGSFMTDALRDRIDREIAERFAEKPAAPRTPAPTAPLTRPAPGTPPRP
jgi:hypothetical protein